MPLPVGCIHCNHRGDWDSSNHHFFQNLSSWRNHCHLWYNCLEEAHWSCPVDTPCLVHCSSHGGVCLAHRKSSAVSNLYPEGLKQIDKKSIITKSIFGHPAFKQCPFLYSCLTCAYSDSLTSSLIARKSSVTKQILSKQKTKSADFMWISHNLLVMLHWKGPTTQQHQDSSTAVLLYTVAE